MCFVFFLINNQNLLSPRFIALLENNSIHYELTPGVQWNILVMLYGTHSFFSSCPSVEQQITSDYTEAIDHGKQLPCSFI